MKSANVTGFDVQVLNGSEWTTELEATDNRKMIEVTFDHYTSQGKTVRVWSNRLGKDLTDQFRPDFPSGARLAR